MFSLISKDISFLLYDIVKLDRLIRTYYEFINLTLII